MSLVYSAGKILGNRDHAQEKKNWKRYHVICNRSLPSHHTTGTTAAAGIAGTTKVPKLGTRVQNPKLLNLS